VTGHTKVPAIVQEARAQLVADHARHGTCANCGAHVIRARAGRIAALDVIADAEPLDATGEILALLQGRLTWHLVTEWETQRITWRDTTSIRAGPPRHPVIADHQCPPQPVQGRLL